MSDNTVQHEIEAVIRGDGSGEIRGEGSSERVTGSDADALRATIMQRMLEFSAARDEVVRLRLTDVDGVYHLLVRPDGDIAVERSLGPLDASGEAGGDVEPGAFAPSVDERSDEAPSEVVGDAERSDEESGDAEHDDDGGFHDEGLDDEFAHDEFEHDEPIDGDFEVPVDEFEHDEPIDGDFEVPVDQGQQVETATASGAVPDASGAGAGAGAGVGAAGAGAGAPTVSPGAWTGPGAPVILPERDTHDGGYSDLFGLDPSANDDTVDLHETIQLPRPGMMHEEPPAVTGLHPIVPPSGSAVDGSGPASPALGVGPGSGSDVGVDGDDDSSGSGDGESFGDVDVESYRDRDHHDHDHHHSDSDSSIGSEPHEPAGDDVYGLGARVAPEWSPRFPRSGGEPAAQLDESRARDAAAAPRFAEEHAPSQQQQTPQPHSSHQHSQAQPPAGPYVQQPHAQQPPAQQLPSQTRAHESAPGAAPTLDDFLADRGPSKALPATRGWRAGLRRTTGGLFSLGPGARERAEREEIAAIQRVFDGPKTIVVVNPKGGAHKTTTTLMVAAMFGMHRGGYTLAWDNNETRGTLGWRSHRADHDRTAVDLLHRLPHFAISGGATIADVDQFVRNQGEAMFDVLASDDDAASAAIIDDDAFSRLHSTLSRFYRVLVIDTGNNMRASNWEAALDVADQLVIVSTAREDTAASAAWLADGLRERGHEHMLADAVTVLSSPSAKEDAQLTARLRDHFAQLTRAVVEVPYDEAFVGGGELDVARLRPETREAWRSVAAVIAQGL